MKIFSLAMLLTLALSACGSAPATLPAAATQPGEKATTTVVNLKKLTYDPKTPTAALEEGRMIFMAEVRNLESIQWNQVIANFVTDEAMLMWAIDKTSEAKLSNADAEKVIRYFLAFRHTSYGADPCE
jgi:hypothetical protein